MITVPLLSCLLKKDVYTTLPKIVPAHELALLSVKYGEGNIQAIEPTGQTMEYEVADEYDRLMRMYGGDGESGRPWVEVVFGRVHEGRMESTMVNAATHYAGEVEVAGQILLQNR